MLLDSQLPRGIRRHRAQCLIDAESFARRHRFSSLARNPQHCGLHDTERSDGGHRVIAVNRSAVAFAKRRADGHVAIDPVSDELRQTVAIVVDVICEEAELEAKGFGTLDLLLGDQGIVFQAMAMVRPRVRSKNGLGRIEDELDRPLPLGVNRNVIARPMKTTELLGELLGLIVERTHVARWQMQALSRELRVLVGVCERGATRVG